MSTSLRVVFIFLLLSAITISGCSRKEKKTKKLLKFNSELWINDKNGCNGDRIELKDQLLSLKHNMRGFKPGEIESYLGKADAQELASRGQRYYIYFIEAGPKCGNSKENPLALFVRFSAVGIANEFTIKTL